MQAWEIILLLLAIFLAIVVALIWLKVYIYWQTGFCTSKARLDGRTIIVTGANVGIGFEAAKDLARRGGKVILACRRLHKGKAACNEIRMLTGSKIVFVKELDVSSLKSVRKFAQEIIQEESRLDVLVLNAGMAMLDKERKMTEDGLELHFATNHFGHFLLTNMLLDLMRRTGNSRVVVVSSDAHKFVGDLDLLNLNGEVQYDRTQVYGHTKLANILFTRELHRRLQVGGLLNTITANSLHPGAVRTNFLDNAKKLLLVRIIAAIPMLFFKNSWEGAQTTIHLCVSEDVQGLSGFYWDNCKKAKTTKQAQDAQLAKRLWEVSANMVKMTPEETILGN